MAFLWFICFVVAAIYARSYYKQLPNIPEMEKLVKQKLSFAESKDIEASKRLEAAKQAMREAKEIEAAADRRVKTVNAENTVFHNAIEEIVNLWINDSWKSIVDKLTASNYATQKNRMEKVFETCRKHGIEFDGRQERAFYVRLESEWKSEVAAEKAKEEQARIKEIMREEQRAEKVRAAEIKRLEDERKELAKKHDEQMERIKLLKEMENLRNITEEQKRELKEALENNAHLEAEMAEKERRKAMAELTRAGNVYVISNIGSFGEKVFKVGMTRRLIPEERIKELGDASVPFPFDCHMMIPSEDAPALESALHKELWAHRLNLVNDGKEFFRTDIQTIKKIVDKHSKGSVFQFKPESEAVQWRESENRRKQNQIGSYEEEFEISDESEEVA